MAIARARRDSKDRGAPPVPKPLRPLIRFTKLPSRAVTTVRDLLDTDADFRGRVAEGLKEADVDRASWLFLTRPEGWAEEFELLHDAWLDELRVQESSSAERRLQQLEESAERTRRELASAREELGSAATQLVEARDERAGLIDERDRLTARVAELEADRRTVVGNLKLVEARSAERMARIRALESALEEATRDVRPDEGSEEHGSVPDSQEPDGASVAGELLTPGSDAHPGAAAPEARPPSPWDELDPQVVGDALDRAASALSEVGLALAEAAGSLGAATRPQAREDVTRDRTDGTDQTAALVTAPAPDGELRRDAAPRPPRRSPVRLLRGAMEGSREALDQLFATPGMVVYVDGYNVTMEAWPQLDGAAQRRSLVDMLGALAARTKADFHVVFDGADDGRRPAVSTPLPVRVHFSHEEVEADDQILDFVAALPTNRPVTVVSSDGRVRTGARRLGANTADSSDLLEYVRRPTR